MKRNIQVFAERVNFGRFVDVQLMVPDHLGDAAQAAQPLVFAPVEEGTHAAPALHLFTETAQQLMDALWDCGLRPTQGQQSHGQFAAQGRHLEDMRAMVGAMAKVELPK